MSQPTAQAISGKAILLVGSRQAGSSLRHQGFNGGWNKLYSVGSCYLDLSLKPEAGYSLLLGKVVGTVERSTGAVHLLGAGGERLETAPLQSSGMFRLPTLLSGSFGLELELGTERFVVSPVDLGL